MTSIVPAVSSPRLRPATLFRYMVSIGVLAWVVSRLDWHQLGGLATVDWSLAVPAVLLAGLAYPLQAWRWQHLLASQGVPLAPHRAHVLFWVGNFYNSFLPGGIAGDGVRIYSAWREHSDHKAAAAASVIADRLLGFGALLALAILALGGQLAAGGGQRELEALLLASAGALGLLAGGTLIVTHTRAWDAAASRWLGSERAGELRRVADVLARDHATLLMATALSVAVWLLDFAALWLLALAVGVAASPLAMCVAGAAAYVAASLPISIGGHGVREGTLVIVLGWLGIASAAPERIWLLALAFWAVSTGWSLAGGLALFVRLRGKIDSARARPPS
jgi:glycosyltransferase 2 family protein